MDTKKCNMCQEILPKTKEFFATRTDRKTLTYQSNCRNCQKEYRKKHYEKNKAKYIQKSSNYVKKTVEWFNNLKDGLECEICGENRYWVLEFHHKDPSNKESEVASLVRKSNRDKILKEIKKCLVLCSNCHKDLHYRQKKADIA